MDKDGADDIITNHHDTITIIYGNKSSRAHSYVSSLTSQCDPQREQRQIPHIKTLSSLGLQLSSSTPIIDDSLIRRQGIGTSADDADSYSSQDEEDSSEEPNPFLE